MLHQTFDKADHAARRVISVDTTSRNMEMGASRSEFVRQLRGLAPAEDMRVDEVRGRAIAVHAEGIVSVTFEARPDRKVGALQIPVTAVEVRFQNVSADQRAEFMARWDRNFLRMGG